MEKKILDVGILIGEKRKGIFNFLGYMQFENIKK